MGRSPRLDLHLDPNASYNMTVLTLPTWFADALPPAQEFFSSINTWRMVRGLACRHCLYCKRNIEMGSYIVAIPFPMLLVMNKDMAWGGLMLYSRLWRCALSSCHPLTFTRLTNLHPRSHSPTLILRTMSMPAPHLDLN